MATEFKLSHGGGYNTFTKVQQAAVDEAIRLAKKKPDTEVRVAAADGSGEAHAEWIYHSINEDTILFSFREKITEARPPETSQSFGRYRPEYVPSTFERRVAHR